MTCTYCEHEHTGLNLAGICIGCPCPHVTAWLAPDQPVCDDDGEPWPCPVVQGIAT